MTARVTAAGLAAAMGFALWVSAGGLGLLYAFVFAAAAAPGIPLGIALFGRRHPAAWIAGGLIGYGLTQLALWAVIAAGVPSAPAFVGAWLLLAAAAWAVGRMRGSEAAVPSAPWTAPDLRALLLVLLLVPALMGLTYRNLGREDPQGNRYYRAYFTADFFWHSALAYELGKFTLPPRNPYLAPRAMNYYWTYFLLPAATASLAPQTAPDGQDLQRYLKANAMLVGLLMMGALFVLVRTATGGSGPAAWAVVLACVAASAEGLYAIADLVRAGRPLDGLLYTNVDAITAWAFGGLRIDNMPRSLWYTPQHTTSIALGLAALTIGVLAGAFARPAAIAGAGLALGLSTTMNPLLGAACSLIYGVCIAADGLSSKGGIAAVAKHALAAAFVIAAVGWGAASRVMDGAGAALEIGLSGFSRRSPVTTLLLSIGPVLVPAIAGVIRPGSAVARRAVVTGAAGILLGLFLLYFVRISEASWVGFRAGQILLVCIPLLLARTIEWLPRRARVALVAVILAVGFPTTAIDTYNAQDIGNRRPSPGGFKWTLWTTPAQEQAFAWIRANTAEDDIVQMEPIVRGREHWTLIPTFAGRRMAAGQPISLLPVPEYLERSNQVKTIFATTNAAEASDIARRLRIDYLYADREDVAEYPEGMEKFETSPDRFEPVFRNGEVAIYRVK